MEKEGLHSQWNNFKREKGRNAKVGCMKKAWKNLEVNSHRKIIG